MGGSSPDIPVSEEVQAASEVAAAKWKRFKEVGIPIQNEAIARLSGYRVNEDGTMTIDPNGILNPDGTPRTDDSSAQAANESAQSGNLQKLDPNRARMASAVQAGGAEQGGQSALAMRLQQDTAAKAGVHNSIRIGRGQKVDAQTSQLELAAQSQQDAANQAQTSLINSQTNSYLAGTVAGIGTSLAMRDTGAREPAPAEDPNVELYSNGGPSRGLR